MTATVTRKEQRMDKDVGMQVLSFNALHVLRVALAAL